MPPENANTSRRHLLAAVPLLALTAAASWAKASTPAPTPNKRMPKQHLMSH